VREPWLTKRELAVELKVSVRTIERHRLPAVARVGCQNRYLLSEVERHLQGKSAAGGEVIELRPRVVA
jgi:hypothetical protein